MQKISEEIYKRINNDIYKIEGDRWWNTDFFLNLIKTLYNPFRVDYANNIIKQLNVNTENKTALEVGCGGGFLTEEIARMGFNTIGIDPSEQSLNNAVNHAKESNLNIIYKIGTGEQLPLEDNSIDVVFCCDVLEHVRDLPKVISEISRVLKIGGIFIYDTFNRTYMSKLSAIKIMQEWKRWAIMPPNLHVWEMFIKPKEIKLLLANNQFNWKEHCGLTPNISYLKMLHYFHQRAIGKLTYEEFGTTFKMVKCKSKKIMYIGYAIKK